MFYSHQAPDGRHEVCFKDLEDNEILVHAATHQSTATKLKNRLNKAAQGGREEFITSLQCEEVCGSISIEVMKVWDAKPSLEKDFIHAQTLLNPNRKPQYGDSDFEEKSGIPITVLALIEHFNAEVELDDPQVKLRLPSHVKLNQLRTLLEQQRCVCGNVFTCPPNGYEFAFVCPEMVDPVDEALAAAKHLKAASKTRTLAEDKLENLLEKLTHEQRKSMWDRYTKETS